MTVDDGVPKYHMPLEEANRLIESNVKLLEPADAVALCAARLSATPATPKVNATRNHVRAASFKTKLGKAVHRLYDLECEAAPEKALPLDLGVNLYQMEEL
jgi:hypothetical protein